jgi:hypothetical protein
MKSAASSVIAAAARLSSMLASIVQPAASVSTSF